MNELLKQLANRLFEIGAIKFGTFKLKLHETNPDAPLSPVYVDLRLIRSFPDVMDLVVEVLKQKLEGLDFDLLADIPTSITPVVAVLSHEMRVPMITPRQDKKTHGSGATIDGVFLRGQRVVLIDDLITKAGSKIEALKVLEEAELQEGDVRVNAELEVEDVVVLLDREQGGAAELREKGYKLHAIFLLGRLLEHYVNTGKITPEKYREILAYLSANS